MPDEAGDISVPSESDKETPGHKRSFSYILMTEICMYSNHSMLSFILLCRVDLFASHANQFFTVFLYFAICIAKTFKLNANCTRFAFVTLNVQLSN